MNLSYRDIDYSSKTDCSLLVKWYNDPAIKHLYSRFLNKEGYAHQFTVDDFKKTGLTPPRGGPYRSLIVLADGIPIGEAKFETDTHKIRSPLPNTAWIALCIGEANFRRRGLGVDIVAYLEKQAAASGALRIELSVLEYNLASLSFFRSLGYQEFDRLSNRAWWNDKMWADIRFLKSFV